MKRPTLIFLIFCAFMSSAVSFGQDLSVSGFIDDFQGEPIGYATVMLMTIKDSTVVNGVSSDERGFFLMDKLSNDTYILKISFLGYNDVSKTFLLTENKDFGTIILEESSQRLNEINVIAKRPTLKKEADRLVFNIENTALTEGNMFQVLKSTPGILVLNNNIQVKNSTPTVYINDKKVHLSSEELMQLLEGSSANSIKSIEVITNPSARYEAESGVVINIVMSKNLVTGYRGNVFTNYTQGVFPRYDVGMSHFFKNEKIDFFANYTYSDSKINRDQDYIVNYLDQNNAIDQTYNSKVNRNTWSDTHSFNFNFDYSINEKNTLSLSSNILVLPYFKYLINNTTTVVGSDQNLDFYVNTKNTSNDDKYNLGFDVDYSHQFKKEGEKLTFNAHYTTYNYQRNQLVNSDYYDADTSFLFSSKYRTDNNQDTEIHTSQLEYQLPLGELSSFETGVKFSSIKNVSDISQFDIVSDIEVNDANNTDAFDYDETIFAAFVNYSKEWDKLSVIAGLRAEQTDVKGVSVFENLTNKQDYLKLFPTASVNYAFSDNFSLYSNYKRSIQRPNYQSLNPFDFYLNDFTIVSGNPNLQPLLIDHAVIGTSIFQRFTIESYYKIYNNNIFEMPIQDNQNNITTYTIMNIDKTTEYGFDFITHFDVYSNWSVYFVTSFYNTKGEGELNGNQIKLDQWTNYSVFSNDLSVLKDKSLNVNFTLAYISKNLYGFQELEGSLVSDLSFSKTLLQKKAIVSLTFADLFNTQDFEFRNRYLNQSSTSFSDIDNRYVKLGFRYKFGNTRLETNQRTKEQQETDRLEKESN